MFLPNLLEVIWLGSILVGGILLPLATFLPNLFPEFVIAMLKYGKTLKHTQFEFVRVPKRWFTHFYVFASILSCYMISALTAVYIFNAPIPGIPQKVLRIFAAEKRFSNVSVESAYLAAILLFMQTCRRLYECIFISVFSDSKMSIFHYIWGLLYYFSIWVSCIADTPCFSQFDSGDKQFKFRNVKWNHVVGILICLWAFKLQYDSHFLMASLRKNKKGKVVSQEHHIPQGGWFEWVSCPHFFAEIVIYLSVCLVFGGQSYYWWLAILYVTPGQISTGLMMHKWYKETFPDYPKNRLAVIPFIL